MCGQLDELHPILSQYTRTSTCSPPVTLRIGASMYVRSPSCTHGDICVLNGMHSVVGTLLHDLDVPPHVSNQRWRNGDALKWKLSAQSLRRQVPLARALL